MKRVINYFLLPLVVLFISCSSQPEDEVVNDILQTVMRAHGDHDVLYSKTVEKNQFKTLMSYGLLEDYYKEDQLIPEVDSVVKDSDFETWRKKIQNYKQIKWTDEETKNINVINKIPLYAQDDTRSPNSDPDTLERIIIVSTPFLNNTSDRALIYVKNYYSPAVASGYLIILVKKNGIWRIAHNRPIWTA